MKEAFTFTLDEGVKASETLSNVGSGVMLFGAAIGNPAVIYAGKKMDEVGTVGTLGFKTAKAIKSGSIDSSETKDLATTVGYEVLSFAITSKGAEGISHAIKKNEGPIKRVYNNFLRTMTDKSVGDFSNKVRKSGQDILGKAIDVPGDVGKKYFDNHRTSSEE